MKTLDAVHRIGTRELIAGWICVMQASCAAIGVTPRPVFDATRPVAANEAITIAAYGRESVQRFRNAKGETVQAIPVFLQLEPSTTWTAVAGAVSLLEVRKRFDIHVRETSLIQSHAPMRFAILGKVAAPAGPLQTLYILAHEQGDLVAAADSIFGVRESSRRSMNLAWRAPSSEASSKSPFFVIALDSFRLNGSAFPADSAHDRMGWSEASGRLPGQSVRARTFQVDSIPDGLTDLHTFAKWRSLRDTSAWLARTHAPARVLGVDDPGYIGEYPSIQQGDWTATEQDERTFLTALSTDASFRGAPVLIVCTRTDAPETLCVHAGHHYQMTFALPSHTDAVFPFWIEKRGIIASGVIGAAAIGAFLYWSTY